MYADLEVQEMYYIKTKYFVMLCTYKPQKGPHLTANCFIIPVINTTTRGTRRATVLLALSICTLSFLLSVRIVHNVHKLCNVHVEYFVV